MGRGVGEVGLEPRGGVVGGVELAELEVLMMDN
jgi:hypothetical protein